MSDNIDIIKNCPECGGVFEEGFVADATYGGMVNPKWTTKVSGWGIFTKVENGKYVITYRCSGCGFLKSFAK